MMSIKFHESENASGRVAKCEIHFLDGDLAGLRLVGFSVWREADKTLRVRFPVTLTGVNDLSLVNEILGGYWEWVSARG